jgi:hypothetical protein
VARGSQRAPSAARLRGGGDPIVNEELRLFSLARFAGLALLAALAIAVAAGCGGGGGGGEAPAPLTGEPQEPPPPPPPPEQPPVAPPADPKVPFGTQGPWPVSNDTIRVGEAVVSVTTDEAQNRWIASAQALYLLRPGETTPRKYGSADGLHLAGNPETYCETVLGYSFGAWDPSWASPAPDRPTVYPVPYPACPVTGAASARGIASIVGGRANEVFVAYYGDESNTGTNTYSGDKDDPGRHSGKTDWVRVKDDGTLDVVRFDWAAIGHGMMYWHNRTTHRLLYDHFVHPGSLYAGTNHGVNYVRVDRWRPQKPRAAGGPGYDEWVDVWLSEWQGDHLHAEAHDPTGSQLLGDWRGLALDADGNLWHAGKWAAGLIAWDDSPASWVRNAGALPNGPGGPRHRFLAHFTPDTGTSPFPPPADVRAGVHMSAVTVARDGRVWFASLDQGLASWKAGETGFQRVSGAAVGLPSDEIEDVVALPDGRLAVAHPSGGVVLWDPATGASTRLPLPSDAVQELQLDTMVSPPALLVATRGGAASFRVLP